LRAANIRYVIVHEWPWTANTNEQVTLRAKLARVFPGVKTRVVSGHQTTITIFQITP
jgi:hypothetical protein